MSTATRPEVSQFPVPDLNTLPQDVLQRMLAVQEKSGFIPNVFLALAWQPAQFRAFFDYHDALMEPAKGPDGKPIGLTKGEREMIVVATSSANHCLYCVVAHGAVLRIRQKSTRVAEQITVDYRKADITPRQEAMLDFAMKVSQRAHEVTPDDYAVLIQHGFTQQDAWDIGAIAAFFAMSNRLASMSGMLPNPEFYDMGRDFSQPKG